VEVCTENLIEEFIGFVNDCEIESDTSSDDPTGNQKTKDINQWGHLGVMNQS